MRGAYLWPLALRFSAMARLAASRAVFSATSGSYPIAWRPSTAAVLDHRPAPPPGFRSAPPQSKRSVAASSPLIRDFRFAGSIRVSQQREHEWPTAPVSAEGDRPRRLHPGSVGCDCARTQHPAPQDAQLPDAGGYTRGDCCIDRLNRQVLYRVKARLSRAWISARRGFPMKATSIYSRAVGARRRDWDGS